MNGGLADDLRRFIKGEVHADNESLSKASTDASMFRVRPSIVVKPKDVRDIQTLVHYANRLKLNGQSVSLTARNGGTCMSGGPLTESIVVDMNDLDHIGEVDVKHRSVSLQGGVMHLKLEEATHPHGLFFAPYTSSRDICGVGGMLGNNASGEQSVKYGPTSSNVKSIKVLLSDGEVYQFGPISVEQLSKKKALPSFEGKIYREITKLIDDNWHTIDHNHPRVKKNAAGYPLWDLWDAHRHTFNLARLFIGAQGTLGIITEAELKLVPFPKASRMIVASVDKLGDLTPIVKGMLKFNPTTVETFDWHTYELAKKYHPDDAARVASVAEGKHLIIFAIYDGDTQHGADIQATKAINFLHNLGFWSAPVEETETKDSFLLIRRKSFKMLLENPHGSSRAMPFIEDTIVDINHYGEFLGALESILREYDMDYTYAGHIGDGSIRLVPLADMEKPEAAEKIVELCQRVYDLVFAFGGSMAVDHNDGILKTPFLERMYGPEMVNLFAETKRLFDPLNIFNPGKKVGGNIDYLKAHIIKENTR